jgi:hypothetical protein
MQTTYGTTLLALRNTVRARCNMSGATAPDQFVPDPELTQYINASYGEFQGEIIRLNELQYLTSSLYVFPGTGSLPNMEPLPTNFAAEAGLERSSDGSGTENSWYSVGKFEFNQRNFGNNAAWPLSRMGIDVMFSIYDWQLVIQPALSCQGTYRLWYYPQPPQLVNDSDTFDDQQQWYEFVVCDACIKVLAKQGEDVSVFAAQKANMLGRIRSMGGNRTLGQAKRYGRGTPGYQGPWGRGGYGTNNGW